MNTTEYTLTQQNELDTLLIKLHYAETFTPHKVEYWKQLIREWKAVNGNLLAPFNCKKNPVIA